MSAISVNKISTLLKSVKCLPVVTTMRGLKKAENVIPIEREEVHIPTPWGHIAGIWWGSRFTKPLLALHGWQDNSQTFNPLIPLLSTNVSVLAIDFPGHGLSSRYPSGMMYYIPDNVVAIRRVVHHFGWKSASLLGHSMGGVSAYMYAACFPDEVDMVAQLDILKPITHRKRDSIEKFAKSIDAFLMIDRRNICTVEPPSYTQDELVERLYVGSSKSIPKEFCPTLLERGSTRSARDPSKYFFSRDYKITLSTHLGISDDDVRAMAKRISSPLLTIKFKGGPYFEPKEKFFEIANIIKEHNKNFELHELPGTHHGHLSEAHLVAPLINSYLDKYHKS